MANFGHFENLLDAVIALNEDKGVIYGNSAAAALLGVSAVRLGKGRPCHKYISFESENFFPMPNGEYREEEDGTYQEINFECKSYKGMAQALVQYIPEDKVYLLFIRDMTLEQTLHKKYKAELGAKEDVIKELEDAQKELKTYSENLEEMVEQRTNELEKVNDFLKLMVNSLTQGLFVFDQKGHCLETATEACEILFGESPKGSALWEVLRTPEKDLEDIKLWAEGIFKELIPFEHYARLGPKEIVNPEGRFIALNYFPMRDDKGKIVGVVVLATDKTEEKEAKEEAKREQNYARMVIKMASSKDQLLNFYHDGLDILKRLKSMAKRGSLESQKETIFNLVHSFKGGAGLFSMDSVERLAHEYESELSDLKKSGDFQAWDNYPLAEVVEKLENEFKNVFKECGPIIGEKALSTGPQVSVDLKTVEEFLLLSKERGPSDEFTQAFKTSFWLRPISSFFGGHTSMLQDLALEQGKKLYPLEIYGGEGLVPPTEYNELFSSLVHAFRNAIGHGIETPDERISAGKDERGKIELYFESYKIQNKNWLFIKIIDDGRGISTKALRKKIIKESLHPTPEKLSEQEIIQFVFSSGISTAGEVTELSGRGVGMGAIKEIVDESDGLVEVYSRAGEGTTLIIGIPTEEVVLFENASPYSEVA